MSVKLSIGTPVVTMNYTGSGPWEAAGTIEDIARIAETADRLGYHHITCSEHIALPASELARRGSAVLGSARHLRLPRRPNPTHSIRHVRAGARRTTTPSRSPSATARWTW